MDIVDDTESAGRSNVVASMPSIDRTKSCSRDCFRVIGSALPCEVCMNVFVNELNSVMSKLSSFHCTVEKEELRLSLEIASPALRLVSAHLAGNLEGKGTRASSDSSECSASMSLAGPAYVAEDSVASSNEARLRKISMRPMFSDASSRNSAMETTSTCKSVLNEQHWGTFNLSSASLGDCSFADIGATNNFVRRTETGKTTVFTWPQNCYINPCGNFRTAWDTTSLLIILWLMIFVPFEVTFLWDTATIPSDSESALWWLAALIDCFFGVDIIMNCFTGFYRGGGPKVELVKRPSAIIKRYARGWLLIDAVSTFPFPELFDAVYGNSNGISALRALRFAKIARLLKVTRGLKLGGLAQILEEHLIFTKSATVAFHSFKLCLWLLISCHWAACFWFLVGYLSGKLGYMTTWLQDFSDLSAMEQWVASFYFCIATGSTVGYGDIHATNTMEMLAGAFLLTCSVMGIGQMLARLGEVFVAFKEEVAETMRLKRNAMLFMQTRNVPRELYFKVLRFLENAGKSNLVTSFDGTGFVEHLSESLQLELRLAIVGSILKSFPVFYYVHDTFIKALCQVVQTQRAGAGDIIVQVDQSCEAMFMIIRGALSYFERNGSEGVLSNLDWFGERALFSEGIVYNMTVVCEIDCELLTLRRCHFLEQLQMFPKVQEEYNSILANLKPQQKSKNRLSAKRGGDSRLQPKALHINSSDDKKARATELPLEKSYSADDVLSINSTRCQSV